MAYVCFHLVEHRHVSGMGAQSGAPLFDCKRIGLFPTVADARAAIARVADAPGFHDAPEGFSLRRVRVLLPRGVTKEGVREVFQAWHEFWDDTEQCDIVTEYPFRAALSDAEADLAALRADPCLTAHPEGFNVSRVTIGNQEWREGYVLWDD